MLIRVVVEGGVRGCRASRGDDGQARWAMGRGCESKQKLGNQQAMRSKGEVSPLCLGGVLSNTPCVVLGTLLALPSILWSRSNNDTLNRLLKFPWKLE